MIRLLYRHVPAVLAANLVNSALVLAALWHQAERSLLLGWLAAILVLTFARVALWGRCRHRLTDADAAKWGLRYTLGSAMSGILWGSSATLFVHPDHPGSLILISFVIGGMGAGAVTSLSAHLPAFHLYLLGSMLPLELRLVTLGDQISLSMAGMALIYVLGLIIIGHNFNSTLTRSLVLNEENQRLLATREEEVRMRTADLQAANTDLEYQINERKAAETGLEVARTQAEQANQAKSRFLAAASHDLRQPLQSMFLFASSLHRHVIDKKGTEALTRIERNLDILKGLLDSLLDLSRLEVNVIEPTLASFQLRPMLDEIVAAYARIAASKGIELRYGLCSACMVRSDQTLLGRMVRNLVENALRYTERGRILLSVRVEGETVRIEVADTGIGIPPDETERIFEEFHQVGNPGRDKAQGLGLGLAIVQRLSRILDHPVGVSSRLGVGSTFSITLPLAAETVVEQPPERTDEAAGNGAGRRVAVIDDDPMVLLALSCIFEQWGYGVTMAGSKDEALGQIQSKTVPDLIVADYRLRDGRIGTDAIRSIRIACGSEIPSIVLTGETEQECAVEAESVGALVLYKPVTSNDLAFALKRLAATEARERHH
ncbi:MAG TPA: ATP-binding protein [Magnetospirillum sp.]|nr:ATP-binding protein [Magnetospirillum sp.]